MRRLAADDVRPHCLAGLVGPCWQLTTERFLDSGGKKSLPKRNDMAEPPPSGPGRVPPPALLDAELLQHARDGDESAFRQLMDRHGAYLYGIARTLAGAGRQSDAEDLVQET